MIMELSTMIWEYALKSGAYKNSQSQVVEDDLTITDLVIEEQ